MSTLIQSTFSKSDRFITVSFLGASVALIAATLLAQSGFYSKWVGYGVSGTFISVFIAIGYRLLHEVGSWSFDETSTIKRLAKIAAGATAFIVCPLFSGLLFFKPSENLSGNQDQGMYLAAAFNIQRTGSTKIALPLLGTLPEAERPLWLPHLPVQFGRLRQAPAKYWSLATGFVLGDQSTLQGPAAAHFPPGLPVLSASFLSFGSFTALNVGNALLTLCAACWLALLVTEWLGPGYSLLIVPVCIFNPLVIWSANRFYAEPLVLFFWIGLVWSLHRSKELPILSGLAAAFATAAACITKIDALAMVGLLGLMIVGTRNQPIWRRTTLAASVAATLAVVIVLWQQNSPYLADTLASLLGDRPLLISSALVIILAVTTSFIWPKFTLFSKRPLLLPIAATVLVTGTIIYLYFIRSLHGPTDRYFYSPLGKEILSYRELTFQRLGWYFPYGGLWPLLAGVILSIRHGKTTSYRLFLAGGVASLVFLAYDVRCNPLQPYCMRRFIPYALPLLFSGAAFITYYLKQKTRYWPTVIFPLCVVYAIGFIGLDRDLHRSNEHRGMRTNLEELAHAIPDDGIVLISARSPLAPLALPLRCIWGKETYILNFDKREPTQLQALKASILKQIGGTQRLFIMDTLESFAFATGLKPQLVLAQKWSSETQPGSYTEIGAAARQVPWQCFLSEFTKPNTGGQPLRQPNRLK